MNGPDPHLDPNAFWVAMERPGPDVLTVDGTELRRGSRVRLCPAPGGDVFDLALKGRVGIIEGFDEDEGGGMYVAVTVEDDPGRDLGVARQIGHRFFFRPREVEPLPPPMRILVAGIGNVFLGDDGFGVAVARALAAHDLPDGVTVRDFGIRGMDLALAMRDYEVAVFVDAAPRGRAPGTLYLIDAILDGTGPPEVATHAMDPLRVLALARALGPVPQRLLVLGCEPAWIPPPDTDEIVARLSPPVEAAVHAAVARIERLIGEILQEE